MATKKKCPLCSSTNVSVELPEYYEFENLGLSNVVLVGKGVEISVCGGCGNTTTIVSDEQQLLQVIGLMIVTGPPGISGEQLRFMRTLMGITQAELAHRLGFSRRETISEWEAGDRIKENPIDELSLKMILLALFREKVIGSEHCFLAEAQVDDFSNYTEHLLDEVGKMLNENTALRELKIKRRPIKKEWVPNLAFA